MTDLEVERISNAFLGPFALRDRALFLLGRYTGFRITELLSLRLRDVYRNGSILSRVEVKKRNMKKQTESRSVPINQKAAAALLEWIREMQVYGELEDDRPLFFSRNGNGTRPMGRIAAWRRLKLAFDRAGVEGHVATHSMRKTFANRAYEKLGGDIFKTQKALGHINVNSTISYLEVDSDEIDEIILSM